MVVFQGRIFVSPKLGAKLLLISPAEMLIFCSQVLVDIMGGMQLFHHESKSCCLSGSQLMPARAVNRSAGE